MRRKFFFTILILIFLGGFPGAYSEKVQAQTLQTTQAEKSSSVACSGCAASPGTWTTLPTSGAPSPRSGHIAIWTGSEMIIWGGSGGNTGARYNPVSQKWTAIPTMGGPSAYPGSVIWTGSEMIVWGCSYLYSCDGARYNPTTNTWTAISNVGAPSCDYSCYGYTSIWTGSEMIVWGGANENNFYFDDGARYNPTSDTWTKISTLGAPSGRYGYSAIWTGSEMIVWGGFGWVGFTTGFLANGARYNPATDTWKALPSSGAPHARGGHTAIWTGSEMVIWGGCYDNYSGYCHDDSVYLMDGARYSPVTDTWTAISTTGAPSWRYGYSATWTGSVMIIWGGTEHPEVFADGAHYNPATDTWTAMSTHGAPSARRYHSAVWTGSKMIIWGGDNDNDVFDDGARYDPVTDTWMAIWTAISSNGVPSARESPTAIWTGKEMIIWGGEGNNQVLLNDGARYNPATNTWTTISNTGTPSPRWGYSAIWTGSEMIIWGGHTGLGGYDIYLGDGARYNPTSDTWTAISNIGAPSPRWGYSAIWTGNVMIVWGGDQQPGTSWYNTAFYNPATDTWTAISSTNAPSVRSSYSAIWTDSEMIIWGGGYNSGARYNPTTNTWIALPISGAPSPRTGHSAIWTGSEMIIWGGYKNDDIYSDGARYNPATNTWTALPYLGTYYARYDHWAVWTGSEMLIWGGYHNGGIDNGLLYNPATGTWTVINSSGAPPDNGDAVFWTGCEMIVSYSYNVTVLSGARYNPETDTWTKIPTSDAPSDRLWYSAIWTGSDMIIWGGYTRRDGSFGYLHDDGARYNPYLNKLYLPNIIR